MKTITLIIGIATVSIMLMSATFKKQTTPWVAPKDADALVNPMKDKADATAEGKKLYTKYCVVCHGEKGKGDGPAGIALNPRPADHSSAKIQSETDGSLYWKITTGRSNMASYKKPLKDEERWDLVNYIRELGKPGKKK
jgi:hypothetical protein